MHRTEGTYHAENLFQDGPPGTRVEKVWLNAVQEEIAHVIETAGITLKTAATETRDQLLIAIVKLIALPTFTKVWFYQDVAPLGWMIDATAVDALLAVKGGTQAYNAAGGTQVGTWSQPSHIHATADHVLSVSEMPAHKHGIWAMVGGSDTHDGQFDYAEGTAQGDELHFTAPLGMDNAGGGGAHNHGFTGSGVGAGLSSWRPLAQLGIICVKG